MSILYRLRYSLKVISLPFFCVSVLCCLASFCDDHLFGGSSSSCSFKGTSKGWGVIY